MTSIPLADFDRLAVARRRTQIVRTGLAAALVVIVAGAIVASAHPQSPTLRFLPRGSTGMVVLDLSASISTDTYQRIGQTLHELASTNGRNRRLND